jgi:acyl-CoA thioester hydrolase
MKRKDGYLAKSIFSQIITVTDSVLDENGHVNNVMYVQWMQEIAQKHYDFIGGTDITLTLGDTWVVREHRIEYLLSAYSGEEIEIRTWVENIRRVRSLRKYHFVRTSDDKLLVRGETDWVYIYGSTGKPGRIPGEILEVIHAINHFD